MEESLTKSLEAIGRFFHLYVITFATYGIIGVIRLLNNMYYKESTPLKFLDMNIYPEYFSLIYGILFFASIIVFHLMYLNLQGVITRVISTPEGMKNVEMIKYSSWVGSPFSKGKIGPIIFQSLIILGMLFCLYLAVAHLFFPMPKNSQMRPLENYSISEKTGSYDTVKHDGSVKNRVIQRPQVPERLYRMIGGFDLIAFAVSVYWFFLWRPYILSIRSKIGA